MYNALTLYYLNQLGIRPWVRKDKRCCITADVNLLAQSESHLKLITLFSSPLSEQAKRLVNQIVTYLLGEKKEVISFQIEPGCYDSGEFKRWRDSKSHHLSYAVLMCGANGAKQLDDWRFDCSGIAHVDPEHLIASPLEKKQLLVDLAPLYTLFNTSKSSACSQ